MTARIQFFSLLDNGKRSFQLRAGTVTSKALTLMSTIVDPVVVDTRDGSVVSDVEGHAYEAGVAYEVRRRAVSEAEAAAKNEWTVVGTLAWLRGGALQRRRVGVHGRDVLVWHDAASGQVGALDGVCYHFGAPLEAAPIEQVAGHACLICPWHRYPIALDTGESFVQPGGVSKGVKQRVHECRVDADGRVAVRLNSAREALASDHYACMGLFGGDGAAAAAGATNLHSGFAPKPAPTEADDGVRHGIVTERRPFLETSLWRLRIEWNERAYAFELGHHVDVEFDALAVRSYTPVRSEPGAVELLVRDCGATSHHLAHLPPGSAVRVREPLGRYVAEPGVARALLVGNGTGVAPLLALLRARTFDAATLLHAQRTAWPDDALAPLAPHARFEHRCLSGGQRIDAALLGNVVAELRPDKVYLCGTDAFCETIVELLAAIGVKREQVFQF